MLKISVLYPNAPGVHFDHDYYRDKHMPLVAARMGSHLKSYSVDKGLAGGAPGVPPPFAAAGHLFCDSAESFQAGFGPHAPEILGDIPNDTNATPVIQMSEVVVG
jgi:uncharacterized protein (TIGR02118 family)